MRRRHNENDEDQLTFDTMEEGVKSGNMDDFMNDLDKMLQDQEQRKEPVARSRRAGAREVTVKRRIAGTDAQESNQRRERTPYVSELELPTLKNKYAESAEAEPITEPMLEQVVEPEQDDFYRLDLTSEPTAEPIQEAEPEVKKEPIAEPEIILAPEVEAEPAAAAEQTQEVEINGQVESDIEQEELMRQKRMALFAKPDILLETPYVVTVGNKQYTRYRIEFGRPDSTIPPELSTSTENYLPKIEEVDELEVEKRKKKIRNKNILREVSSWVSCIVIAVIIALVINNFIFSFVRVQGDSMLDTLNKDNWLFVWRAGYIFNPPQRGDVVICHFDQAVGELDENAFFIKRVVALPGETVSIEDGYVYVDGRKLEEDYLTELRRDNEDMAQIVLGEDEYFVLGDNRINSTDSRLVGPVKKDQIIGKAVQKLLPINQFGPV